MSSNFGGDGGDVLVDPNDGCNIVQEYVVLAMRVTNKCARQDTLDAFLDVTKSNTRSIAPPDVNARFIAPFVANKSNINQWLAGGNSVWFQDKGFAIQNGSDWKKVKTWSDAGKVTTALAFSGTTAVAAFCGPCNNAGFARGGLGRHVQPGHQGVDVGRQPARRRAEPLRRRGVDRRLHDHDRAERLLAPLHRGPGQRPRPRLPVDERRGDVDER
jgi:hypothetical protein